LNSSMNSNSESSVNPAISSATVVGAGFHMILEIIRLAGVGATVPTEKVASLRADQMPL